MSQQILRQWSDYFRDVYHDVLPRDYMCFDCETTGLRREDIPVEIGHVIVRDCQIVQQGSFVLDWTSHPKMPRDWLGERLRETAARMRERGLQYRFTPELLQSEGVDANRVLRFYRDLFLRNRGATAFFVGHNSWFCDAPLLEACFREFLQEDFQFDENEMFDTGGMEKACLLGILPEKGETMKKYFMRVRHAYAPGTHWNIQACVERHGLQQRHSLDTSALHGAQYDSYVTHLIFEEHRGEISVQEPHGDHGRAHPAHRRPACKRAVG